MEHLHHLARRGLGVCAALTLGNFITPYALALSQTHSPLGINSFDAYISGPHGAPPGGVIDPYTGQEVEVGNTLQTEFTAPYMSYLRESQSGTEQGLSYDLGSGLSLNYDPATRRVNTDLNLTGDDKKNVRLRVKPGEYKAVFIYRWN